MRKRKGFTLVELLVVVLILGALAAIAVPRIIGGATTAKINACNTNIDLLNSQIELYYINTGAYPASLAALTGDANYFAPTDVPTCPYGTAYVYSSNRITAHSH